MESLYTELKTFLLCDINDGSADVGQRAKIIFKLAVLCFLCSGRFIKTSSLQYHKSVQTNQYKCLGYSYQRGFFFEFVTKLNIFYILHQLLPADNIDDRKELLVLLREKVKQNDPDVIINSLAAISLILTVCTPTERKNVIHMCV